MRTPLDAVGGVAGTPKIESLSAAGLPDFVYPPRLAHHAQGRPRYGRGFIHKL